MATNGGDAQVGSEIPDEAREMDEQFLSEGTARDYAELDLFLGTLPGADPPAQADGADVEKTLTARYGLPDSLAPERRASAQLDASTYTEHLLTSTAGARTYRLKLRLDDDFRTLGARVVTCTQAGLDRVTSDQSTCFVDTANEHGLTWRRPAGLKFPHSLPYLNPPPTTNSGRYAEEAAVIAAAFHFPLSLPSPGISLTIDRRDRAPRWRKWVLGSADVNLYADQGAFLINLNGRAIRDASFNDDTWAATIVHEMMHNLGWGHPRGSYNITMAIENYESCIRGARSIETPDNLYPIR